MNTSSLHDDNVMYSICFSERERERERGGEEEERYSKHNILPVRQ